MFNIEQFPSILLHFKSISKIFKLNSAGWYEIFCPYCDDATRKINPTHGHFYLASDYPYGHCFRCGCGYNLIKILIDTGFKDNSILDELKKFGKIIYNSSKRTKKKSFSKSEYLNSKLLDSVNNFCKNNINDYLIYQEYVYNRCFEINPLDFLLIPQYINNQLVVQILNSSGHIVTNRFINPINPSKRYHVPNEKSYYYFQNIENIIECENIIFCEGAFDLINLYKYNPIFNNKNSFYISIGGSNYKGCIQDIVSQFLLIGKYNINVVFDSNVINIDKICNDIQYLLTLLNPELSFNFYKPVLFKDVSDLCNIERI